MIMTCTRFPLAKCDELIPMSFLDIFFIFFVKRMFKSYTCFLLVSLLFTLICETLLHNMDICILNIFCLSVIDHFISPEISFNESKFLI